MNEVFLISVGNKRAMFYNIPQSILTSSLVNKICMGVGIESLFKYYSYFFFVAVHVHTHLKI